MASCFACRWHHDADDEPVMLSEELDDERMETRKVHEFRDSSLERPDEVRTEHRTSLGCEPVPALEDIDAHPDFTGLPLTADEFYGLWQQAGG